MPPAPSIQIPTPLYALVDEQGSFPTYRRNTLLVWTDRQWAEQFLQASNAPAAQIGELPTEAHVHEILTDVIQDAAEFVAIDPQDDSGDADGIVLPIQDVLRSLSAEMPVHQAL